MRTVLQWMCLAGAALAILCNPTENNTPAAQLSDLCLKTGDIPGWTVWEHPCTVLGIDELYTGSSPAAGSINGGAGVYDERGMQKYFYQELSYGEKTAKGHIMDFGIPESTQAIIIYMDTYLTDMSADTIAGLGQGVMLERYGGNAVYVMYAMNGRFYFELTFEGMTGDSDAILTVQQFLNTYYSRL